MSLKSFRSFAVRALVLAISAGALQAHASLVTFSGTPSTLSGVSVYPTASVATPDGAVTLGLSGDGVRHKYGAGIYVASSYVGNVAQFQSDAKSSVIDAVAAQKVRVLDLTVTFILGMTASEVHSSFTEALQANNVSSTAIDTLLNTFNFGLSRSQTAVIITYPKGDGEELVIEATGHAPITADDATIGTDFWKIWFGVPDDSDLGSLQKLLVGG
jgi:hypothetical protein